MGQGGLGGNQVPWARGSRTGQFPSILKSWEGGLVGGGEESGNFRGPPPSILPCFWFVFGRLSGPIWHPVPFFPIPFPCVAAKTDLPTFSFDSFWPTGIDAVGYMPKSHHFCCFSEKKLHEFCTAVLGRAHHAAKGLLEGCKNMPDRRTCRSCP